MGLRFAHTATIRIIPMPVRLTAFTVRSGLRAEYLSAQVLGITGDGAMAATTVAPDTTDTGTTAAVSSADEATLEVMLAEPMVAASPVTTREEAMPEAIPVADSMAADSPVVAAVASTVVADTAADIGN